MSEPTYIDNLAAIQQAVREGKEWEYRGTSGEWFCPHVQTPDNLNSFAERLFRVRLKPEPPKPRIRDGGAMSHELVFQALAATCHTLIQFKKALDEILDPQDARLQEMEVALDNLTDVLFVQRHTTPYTVEDQP